MRSSVATLALFVAAFGLQAQQPQPAASSSTTATLSGTISDSTTGGLLAGADIVIGGSTLSATTDSLGRFEVSGLEPGTYQVGVFHPRLDTLEVALTTAPFAVLAGRRNAIELAIPSARTLIAKRCGRPAGANESLLTGKVLGTDNGQPVPAASVSLAWTELTITTESGMRADTRLAHASTDSSGRYTFCGVPSDLHGTIQARRDASATAMLPVTLNGGGNALTTRNLFVSSGKPSSESRGRLTGTVRLDGSTGATPEGARAELTGTSSVAKTDKQGSFALSNLPLGSQLLVVRKVGFTSQAIQVDILAGEPAIVTVALTKFVSHLDPVVVTARVSQALKSVGFDDRQRQGRGRYVTRADIEKHRYTYLSDIIRSQVPAINLQSSAGGPILSRPGRSIVRGSACVRYFVDDVLWHSVSENDIDVINPSEIAGIEIYRGNAAPIRYSMVDDCTTIVIWTKTRVGS